MDSNFDLIALGNLHKSDYTRADEELNIKEIKFAIDTLDDHQKIPFEMVQQGYKYNEIAELQNINIGTVKSRIHMARKNIIKALES
jgi:RNA polymerase sigma-70 factor (ECF subfamily)